MCCSSETHSVVRVPTSQLIFLMLKLKTNSLLADLSPLGVAVVVANRCQSSRLNEATIPAVFLILPCSSPVQSRGGTPSSGALWRTFRPDREAQVSTHSEPPPLPQRLSHVSTPLLYFHPFRLDLVTRARRQTRAHARTHTHTHCVNPGCSSKWRNGASPLGGASCSSLPSSPKLWPSYCSKTTPR